MEIQALLATLKHVVSVTPEDFQILYAKPLQAIAAQQAMEVFAQTSARILAVLKQRRAYMLPFGADTETCYQQQDSWTYALFTAALLQNEETLSAEKYIPIRGLQWLKSFPALYEVWSAYLNGKAATDSPLVKIIEQAEAALKGQLPVAKNAEKILGEENKSVAINIPTIIPTEAHFIAWLQEALIQQTIRSNETESLVQHVREGIFLIMPGLYEFFLAHQPQFTPLKFQKFVATLSVNVFIFPKKGKLHRYYQGNWHARQTQEGLLVPRETLFTSEMLPPVNTRWQYDVV